MKPLLGKAFGALADGTRRAMLARLLAGEATVTELAAPHGITLAALLKHLRVLEDAGLVESRKAGRVRTVALRGGSLADMMAFLDAYRAAALPRFDARAGFIDLSDMDVT